jgi:hypothetical protein
MYEIDEDYLFFELEKLLEGGIGMYDWIRLQKDRVLFI